MLEELQAKRVEAEEIILKSPNGNYKITLKADDTIGGIWVEHNNVAISIYATDKQVAMGIYGKLDRANAEMSIALSTDKDGNPHVQLVNDKGAVKVLSFEDFPEGK